MTTKFRDGDGNPLKGQALADAIKRHGVAAFNAARADDPDWLPDLTDANLTGVNLHEANLRNANLYDADLHEADLRNADLHSADLAHADLRGVNLRQADLYHANLRRADLSRADLNLINLREADLSAAKLSGAKLRYAKLRYANLRHAVLRGADLHFADLTCADLSETNLSGAKGLLDPVAWVNENFEMRDSWIVAYKAVGKTLYTSPWGEPQPGMEITEVCNPCRTVDCGCGINVATLEWVKANYPDHEIWEILVHPVGTVVPYATDGKFRASRARWSKRVQVCMRGEES